MFYKILIVDDDQDFCLLVQKALQRNYFDNAVFFVCHDGETAVEIFKDQLPDLVILDVMMPIKNGWEACQQMRTYERRHVRHHTATIIILTAIGPNLNEMTAPLYGADDYFDKPTDLKRFANLINEIIRGRRAA